MSAMSEPAPRRVIDLAHPITDGTVTYLGIPAPALFMAPEYDDASAVYAPGTELTIGMITVATNTGTYLDTPAHRHRGGEDLAAVVLTSDLLSDDEAFGMSVAARVRNRSRESVRRHRVTCGSRTSISQTGGSLRACRPAPTTSRPRCEAPARSR